MDAWRSPELIRQAHFPDEISNFTGHFRPSRPTLFTLPGPIEAESAAMPGNDRFRLDDDERRTPASPLAQQPHPQATVHLPESNAPTLSPSKCIYLVAEGKNLQLQGCLGSEAGAEGAKEGKNQGKHWERQAYQQERTNINILNADGISSRHSARHNQPELVPLTNKLPGQRKASPRGGFNNGLDQKFQSTGGTFSADKECRGCTTADAARTNRHVLQFGPFVATSQLLPSPNSDRSSRSVFPDSPAQECFSS